MVPAVLGHCVNRLRYRAVAPLYRVIWIQPSAVKHKVGSGAHRGWAVGTIAAGDWDLDVHPYSDSPKYRGLVERFEEGREWRDTTLFRVTFPERLVRDGEVLGLRSLRELEDHYRTRIDPLFHELKARGFAPPSLRKRVDAVYAFIGRGGEIIWGPGGNHRLSLAKILDLERIPVRIHARHAEWQKVRERMSRLGEDSVPDDLKGHPDLDGLGPGAGQLPTRPSWPRSVPGRSR